MGRTWKFQLFSYCTPQQPLTTICIDLLDPFRYENSPEDYIVWIGPNIHNKMWMKIYLIINGIDAINIITSKISCIIANDRVVSSLNHILFIFRYILLLLCLMRAYERMIWCDDFDFLFQCFFWILSLCLFLSITHFLSCSLLLIIPNRIFVHQHCSLNFHCVTVRTCFVYEWYSAFHFRYSFEWIGFIFADLLMFWNRINEWMKYLKILIELFFIRAFEYLYIDDVCFNHLWNHQEWISKNRIIFGFFNP